MDKIKFTSTIARFDSDLWHFHLIVPNPVVSHFKQKNIKRFICELNNQELIHCAIMPAGEDRYFININKALRKKLELNEGSEVVCKIWEDTSKYGMPLPEEFEEVLYTDPEGERLFESLTPGKKRSLIHIVAKLKNSDKRIEKSLIIINHLISNQGKLDFKSLNEAFKLGLDEAI